MQIIRIRSIEVCFPDKVVVLVFDAQDTLIMYCVVMHLCVALELFVYFVLHFLFHDVDEVARVDIAASLAPSLRHHLVCCEIAPCRHMLATHFISKATTDTGF